MILYFADRQLNIQGHASTELLEGLVVIKDRKTDDVETGVSVFECTIPFDEETRSKAEACAAVGNHILRDHNGESGLFTIIDREVDTKKREIYVYAEDDGMDLLNEVVGEYEADKAYPINHYINKYAANAGFEIGINEVPDLTRKLSWDGESTATARIASIATQFDGCEVSYSFKISGLTIAKKYINIYKKRGKDVGITLRLNEDIDGIITKSSIGNLATALQCVGGTPENEEDPITLNGYTYDDGDFYVDGTVLKSRNALKKWCRFLWKTSEEQREGGHITKQFSYDTPDQKTLCAHAITELKQICDMEVNYEVELGKLPDNVKIGDRVNIVDDEGELYLSTRILQLETSVDDQESKVILGEHLLRDSGIHSKVAELAAQFAKYAASSARAMTLAKSAKSAADAAQAQANSALANAQAAQEAAGAAQTAANTAAQSAQEAQEKAAEAKSKVDCVEESISSLETTITNAQQAADNAYTAANTAQAKADEAAQAAAKAKADAADASAAVSVAQGAAETAITKADEAKTTANTAKDEAATAKATADAAKLDAEKAEQDIASLGNRLDTVSNTMESDYARKTELTETEASLQTQISQNAAELRSHAQSIVTIDETVNNAAEQAAQAQTTAAAAQTKADQATVDAQAAQAAANNAAAAASSAQSEADKAKAAAATAKSVADKAETDLAAAKADLATVTGRVDATEEEIQAAQEAVTAAQEAANKANVDAEAAAKKATDAQSTADTAVTNAANAQATADNAASAAATAQAAANAAQGDATEAINKANEAATAAANAQSTADTAKTNATNAQAKADQAALDAAAAQRAADDADSKAAQAASDLATAQQNLANVTSRVGATEEEIAAAQQAVQTAQAAANQAKADAEAAQSTANTAKANAATAQTAANNAKTAADNAQTAADDAQKAADDAQAAVDALAVRVTTAETEILQNSQAIELRATKEEVSQTLGGYYTKTQTDAKIKVEADKISSQATEIGSLGTRTSTLEQRADGFDVSIADAAKKATSFLSYDATNGLQVGNKQSGSWSGYRSQIKSDSFNILDASGNELASYGANKVDIGKNSDDTVISFCNGRSSISFDESSEYASFHANIASVDGDDIAALRAHRKEGSGESYTNNASVSASAMGSSPNIRLYAARYPTDADDNSVGSDSSYSLIVVWDDKITLESDGPITLRCGDGESVTIEGDAGITGQYYDNLGQPIRNGLAAYNGGGDSGIDPNTTLEEIILTSHSHAPQGLGTFYYIHTVFYSAKTTTANRAQIAIPYNSPGSIYFRYYSGSWSAWRKPYYGGEDATFGKLELYRSGTPYIDLHYNSTNPSDGVDYTQRIAGSDGGLMLYHGKDTGVLVMSDRFRSTGNDVHYLGDASNRWKAVYAVNGAIQTSDRNQKKNIEELGQKYIDLFDKLMPVSFMFNDTESDRVHIGFISQDVKTAMDEVGLTDLDFAGFCRDVLTEWDNETHTDKTVLDENGEPVYRYSLRYSEFIALNSKMIQLNREKIARQQIEIDTLKADVDELKKLIATMK